jgi:hypothetical protein
MNVVGVLQGIGVLLFIVLLAGAIAYVGDRVGHQVGRKRLTLFNIRPRYTSTIIAVATGMLIALIVTVGAIFASNQVKTAFFRLGAIYAEIDKAQATERELEHKVNESHVIIGVDTLLTPGAMAIPMNSPVGTRRVLVREFYDEVVRYVNTVYTRPPFNLKPFVPPSEVDRELDAIADKPQMDAWVSRWPVLLIAQAGQNLYEHDQIHFGITATPDKLMAAAGEPIAGVQIPAGKNVSAPFALNQLLSNWVPQQMAQRGMPPYFLRADVSPNGMLPSLSKMQSMLSSGSGTYIMTAFAAENIFPHTGYVPVVVTLQKMP